MERKMGIVGKFICDSVFLSLTIEKKSNSFPWNLKDMVAYLCPYLQDELFQHSTIQNISHTTSVTM